MNEVNQVEVNQSQPVTPSAQDVLSSASKAGALQTPIADKEAPQVDAPKKEESVSSKFAALARKEKAAFQKIEQAKKRESELSARELKIKEIESLYEQSKTNPLEALKHLGWTYQQITDFMLNGEKVTPDHQIKAVEDKFQSYVKQQEEKEAQRVAREKQAEEDRQTKAIEAFKSEVKDFVTDNFESYELINLNEAHDLVTETIEAHFERSKKLLSNKEAADLVESYLEEQLTQKLSASKKLQSKFSRREEQAAQTPTQKSAPSTAPKTMSNAVQSSAPSLLPAKTENDRLQRALAALSKSH